MRKSSKDKYANQPRRQSPRLRVGSALLEEEYVETIDTCSQQQQSVNNYIVKQLTFEMQEPEDIVVCKPSEHINAVGDSGSDDLTIIDITLKDLLQKCKAKTRKGLKLDVASLDHSSHPDSDRSPIHHDHIKVKEEESDLEEPLIILKQKITKASTRQRKHRKRALVDLLVAENNDNFLLTPSECSLRVDFPPITTKTSSTYHELSEHDEPVIELQNVQEQGFMETANSILFPMATKRSLHSDVPELSYNIKSEIVEAYSLKQHTKYNCTFGFSLGNHDDNELVGNSSPEQIQEVSKDWPERKQKPFNSFDNSDHCLGAMKEASILSVSELKNGIHVDGHFTNTVKSELFDETSPQEYASSNVEYAEDFIERVCQSQGEDAMTNLHHSADADLPVNDKLSSTHRTTSFYCVDGNSTDHEELVESLPAIDVDAFEIRKVTLGMSREESLQVPTSMSDTFYHNSVDDTVMYPDADKLGSNKNHDTPPKSTHESRVDDMESPGDSSYKSMGLEPSCNLNMTTCGFQDSTDDMTLQGVAICSQGREIHSNCNLPCEELYGLEEIFLSSKDNLNGAADVVTCCSDEFSNFIDAMRLKEKSVVQPSTISSSCITVLNDGQRPGSNLVKATEDSCPFPEENLNNTLDQLVCNEKLHLVNSLGKRQAEGFQSLMDCHSPKKLLSNRQTISPSSQEKLRWGLDDICTNNSNQIIGQSEAGYLTSPMKCYKRRRNNIDGPLSPVKKVNLKSPNISCMLPSSCSRGSSLTTDMGKAIVFTQRQMRDIEKLATQLLNGLNLMRNVVEETIIPDVHNFVSSNFTAEEIRAANENALELERTTKKWLRIMAKDCNRFCKIMEVADDKSAVPATGVCRQRRKITFADEVGGVLCHVKVFERQQSPVITSESQQTS